MRQKYDFSNAKNNPYASKLKEKVSIYVDEEAINYFKSISEEVGIPYESMINLYLRDCAVVSPQVNFGIEIGFLGDVLTHILFDQTLYFQRSDTTFVAA